MFTIVNSVLLEGPPYPEADRLYMLWQNIPQEDRVTFSVREFNAWKKQTVLAEHEQLSIRRKLDGGALNGQRMSKTLLILFTAGNLLPQQVMIARVNRRQRDRERLRPGDRVVEPLRVFVAQLGALTAGLGEHAQRAAGHAHPGRVGQHGSSWWDGPI